MGLMARMPRSLTQKYTTLAHERADLKARLAAVEAELTSVGYALKVIDPSWAPPAKLPRRQKRVTGLPRGAVAGACLEVLRRSPELSTPEIAARIAMQHRLRFADSQAELDFASSVAMALRRYERQGLVEVVGKDERSGALRWRLKLTGAGRLSVVAG